MTNLKLASLAAALILGISVPALAQSVGPTDPAKANTADPNSSMQNSPPTAHHRTMRHRSRATTGSGTHHMSKHTSKTRSHKTMHKNSTEPGSGEGNSEK
jgi:hypothetical protein